MKMIMAVAMLVLVAGAAVAQPAVCVPGPAVQVHQWQPVEYRLDWVSMTVRPVAQPVARYEPARGEAVAVNWVDLRMGRG